MFKGRNHAKPPKIAAWFIKMTIQTGSLLTPLPAVDVRLTARSAGSLSGTTDTKRLPGGRSKTSAEAFS